MKRNWIWATLKVELRREEVIVRDENRDVSLCLGESLSDYQDDNTITASHIHMHEFTIAAHHLEYIRTNGISC